MTALVKSDGRRAAPDAGEIEPYNGEPDARPTALAALTRAEIDVQVATARQYPRSAERFLREARALVSLSPEVAASCTYRLPPRAGSPQPITGPSVRLAEIVACCWGNLRIMSRIIDDDGKTITAQGNCLDLEKNLGYSIEVRRGIVTSKGYRYGEHMVNTTCNAAMAIAGRNATFKAIPRALVDVIENEAKLVARGDVKTLPERTERALAFFASKGVAEAEVFRALGVVGRADVTLDHLMTLQGYRTSIAEGHATAEQIFAPVFATVAPAAEAGESRAARLARHLTPPPPERDEPSFAPGTSGQVRSEAEPAEAPPSDEPEVVEHHSRSRRRAAGERAQEGPQEAAGRPQREAGED